MYRSQLFFVGLGRMGQDSIGRVEMPKEIERSFGGESLLQSLPDDVLSLISKSLQPRDLCNLSMACKKLDSLLNSDKIWWQQCVQVVENGPDNLQAWRAAVSSYKILCRFLVGVKPLIGIWVHQNPELGNMVYVMWGFVSVVGCRIIPQELGPRGFESGLLWAPVFEVICNADGSLALFLHGREKDRDFCYPGALKPAKEDCNVLLLEVELLNNKQVSTSAQGRTRTQTESQIQPHLGSNKINPLTDDRLRRSLRSGSKRLTLVQQFQGNQTSEPPQFSKLGFGDRRRLLEFVAHVVRLKVPHYAGGPLFPTAGNRTHSDDKDKLQKDFLLLSERRSLLIWMQKHGDPNRKNSSHKSPFDSVSSRTAMNMLCRAPEHQESFLSRDYLGASRCGYGASVTRNAQTDISAEVQQSPKKMSFARVVKDKSRDYLGASRRGYGASVTRNAQTDIRAEVQQSPKKMSFARVVKDKMKQIIGFGGSSHDNNNNASKSNMAISTVSETKRVQLQDFLRNGDAVGLCLHPSSLKLSMYRAWPIMHDNRFALYKMPQQRPDAGIEHAGLWGGTFGWPPSRPAEDKPGKALFFLLLSYEETDEGLILIATKILEGTHYVLHPNGSAMFVARINEQSMERFPWEIDKDSNQVDVIDAYHGEGIANGYGFRYPGSKPGDLFVCSKGMLAFVWRESKAVLTLQRMDLQSLLRKGERVAALPPIANFAYLTKSYSNVFAGYSGLTNSMSSSSARSFYGPRAL